MEGDLVGEELLSGTAGDARAAVDKRAVVKSGAVSRIMVKGCLPESRDGDGKSLRRGRDCWLLTCGQALPATSRHGGHTMLWPEIWKYVNRNRHEFNSSKSWTYVLALSVACTNHLHHIDRRDGYTV